MTDHRHAARHVRAVMARAEGSGGRRVMPASWRERRALRRMAERGEAWAAPGLPDVWVIR